MGLTSGMTQNTGLYHRLMSFAIDNGDDSRDGTGFLKA